MLSSTRRLRAACGRTSLQRLLQSRLDLVHAKPYQHIHQSFYQTYIASTGCFLTGTWSSRNRWASPLGSQRRSLLFASQPLADDEKGPDGRTIEAILKDLNRDLVHAVKRRDYDAAMAVYRGLKGQGIISRKINTYSILLSLCEKYEHLDAALEIMDEMINAAKIAPIEPMYVSLIRIYADGDHVDSALGILKQMGDLGMEKKLRAYQPIYESYLRQGDMHHALDLIMHAQKADNVTFESEQLKQFLVACVETGAFEDPGYVAGTNRMIEALSKLLLGERCITILLL
jgi:pentatricopeptide repeat protein